MKKKSLVCDCMGKMVDLRVRQNAKSVILSPSMPNKFAKNVVLDKNTGKKIETEQKNKYDMAQILDLRRRDFNGKGNFIYK